MELKLFKCPACNGTGEDSLLQCAFGNIYHVACSHCQGKGGVDQEVLRAIEMLNPELFWENAFNANQ